MVQLRSAENSDYEVVVRLLAAASLPTEDLAPSLDGFLLAVVDDQVAGAIALDGAGPERLLRSLVVAPDRRGAGLGVQLTEGILQRARRDGVTRLVLLTTTAERFFPRFGFQEIGRDDVGAELSAHHEFTTACPSSAIVMALELG